MKRQIGEWHARTAPLPRKTGYIVFVTRWSRTEGKQRWESLEKATLAEADEYAGQAVWAGRDSGEKVVASVWQTENGNPTVNLYAHEQRTEGTR